MNRVVLVFLVLAVPLLGIALAWLGWLNLGTNLLSWFLIVTGLVYSLGVLIAFGIRGKEFWHNTTQNKILKEERGDRSFWAIIPGMVISFFVPPIEYRYLPQWISRHFAWQIVGLILVLMGTMLFIWARRLLRKSYTGHLATTEAQDLVQSGPYHFIRHPAYLGFLLMALGICLGFSSLIGLICIPLVLLPGFVYRIQVEEKLLADHFEERYRNYAARTWRLIPYIW